MMIDANQIFEQIGNWILNEGPQVLFALIVLIVGWKLIGFFIRVLEKSWAKRKFDASLRHFLERLISITLKVLLLISVASMIGLETTSFVAVIGAAGLAVGLALQGSLANFAGGVLILIFKPFVVDEFVETQGHTGTVKHIDIFSTVLLTLDNKTVIIPNGAIMNDSIINYSREDMRRVDHTIGISYDDDIKKAQKILVDIAHKHKLVVKEPEPFIRVSELGDNAVNFTIRLWVKTEDYWTVYFDILESVKIEFDKKDISFPYPQMDVHLHKDEE